MSAKPKKKVKAREAAKAKAAKKAARGKGLKMIGFSLVLLLILQEVLFRVCFPIPELKNFNRIKHQVLAENVKGFPYVRNTKREWHCLPDTNHAFVHKLNMYGYRDSEWPLEKDPEQSRIMWVGDSFVEGMMSTQDKKITDGFLAAAGAEADHYDLMNCGMMGIGLEHYTSLLMEAVPVFAPDEVFLVLYSNDIAQANLPKTNHKFEPEFYNSMRPRLLELLDHWGTDSPIPFRWNDQREQYYQAVPAPTNPWTANEAQWAPDVREDLREAMKLGKFNSYRRNWVLVENTLLRAQVDLSPNLKFLRDFLNQYKTKLRVFYIPSRVQVSTYYYQFDRQSCLQACPDEVIDLTGPEYHVHAKMLADWCNNLGLEFHDLTPAVQAAEDNGNHLYWNYDDHMRAKGYMLLGKEIWQAVSAE